MSKLNLDGIDLSTFGSPIDDPSVGDIVNADQSQTLSATLGEAVKVSPDDHAKNIKLSRASGVPAQAVAANPKVIETDLKLQNIDFSGMSKRSPNTTKFLVDFDNAVIAQDDLGNMESLEAVLNQASNIGRALPAGFLQQFGSAFDGAGRAVEAGGRSMERLFDAALPESADRFFKIDDSSPALLKLIDQLAPSRPLRAEGGGLKTAAENIGPAEADQNIATDISAGVGQVTGQILTYLMAPQVGVASLFSQGVDQQGERQEKSGTEGRDQTADLALFTGGAVTAATEKLGIDKLLDRIPTAIKNQIAKQITDLAIAGGVEALQEVVEGLGQGLLEQYTTNPDAEVLEGLDREAIAAGGTGAIVRGIVNAMTPGRFNALENQQQTQVNQGAVEQQSIDALAQGAAASKLRERDPESFHAFMQSADGDKNTRVFIDGAQLKMYLADKNIKADAGLTAMAKHMDTASTLGSDVSIPVADFATYVAGTPHFDALRPFMTLSGETVAPFRAEQAKEETRKYVESLMTEAQASTSQFIESQEIFTSVRDQLVDTGMVTSANAKIMAQVVPAWATVFARKNGITVKEAYERSGLMIEGPQTGRAAGETVDVTPPAIDPVEMEKRLAPRPDRRAGRPDNRSEEERRAGDRRRDSDRRAKLDAMTPEERYAAIYRNELTGLNNRRAFEEDLTASPVIVSIDVDSLKTVNDNLGHDAGDNLLKIAGKAIHDATNGKAYHISGDEFYVLGDNQAEIEQQLAAAKAALATMSVISDKGEMLGVDFTYGVGADKASADSAMEQSKHDREARGERVPRGELPRGLTLRQRLEQSTVDQTQTEAFKQWFADSKVVDADGKPLVVYHGTGANISQFDTDNPRMRSGKLGKGIYFTPSTQKANLFANLRANDGNPNIMPVFVSMTNPLEIYGENNRPVSGVDRESLQAEGYDGVILFDDDGVTIQEVVAFEPTQIKSATGNNGAFNPNDPSILNQGPRGYFDPSNTIIRLTEVADLSTFLHEFAHFMFEMEIKTGGDTLQQINSWFIRNVADVSKEAGEYAPNTTIIPRHVTAYINTGTAGDVERDEAIRRAMHEQFARGFEAYLMEGKAPSIQLRNAFRSFARWLGEIYRAIRGDMRVSLDDQMREVFDRILATDEQIAAAETRAQIQPLFTDATMTGMTEEEYAAYLAQQQVVKDKQHETLRDKLIKEITRQTKSWWKEERADLIDEALIDLRNEPVYRAAESLRGDDIKLDLATVKAMVGVDKTDAMGRESRRIPDALRGMTAPGQLGVHPDEAAAFFGFNTGAELLDALITSPPLKTAATEKAEAAMKAKHGDILNDGTIEREADEALQNEERGELLLTELKALNKGRKTPTLDRDTVKAMAEEAIAKLSYREIQPTKYRRAEIRAAQEAAAALANGNTAAAAQAKGRQLLNFYLGTAATDAKKQTDKIVTRMARYTKATVRQEIMKAENGYMEQIDKILSRFEFRKAATLRQVDQVNQDLNSWVRDRTEIDGDALVLSAAVLDETYVTHWKNVSYSDLQGVNDSVKNLEHVARYSNKMTRLGEEMEFKALVQKWTDHMNAAQPNRFKSQRTSVIEGRNWGRWAMAQMTKIPYLASWLDGGERVGLSHQILVQPMTDALDAEIKMWAAVGKPVMDAIMNRSKADLKRHNTKLHIPEIADVNNDGHLMGHQVLAVALNTGNQGNLRKMLLGEGWANPEVEGDISIDNPKLQAVLKYMTASDWQMVQMIWDQMDSMYPQLAEVHRKTTGLTPPKVEATPVVTPFGTFKGGYYPVKYDANRSFKAEQNEERLNAQTDSMFSSSGSIQASVSASATSERTQYYAPVRLSLDVVPSHFQETIHYITHHAAVREVNKLIRNAAVAETIKAKLGPEEFAQLKPWLNDIAKNGKNAPNKSFIDAAFQRLRMGTTLTIMGFKASTGIMQTLGIFNTAAEVGVGPTLKGVMTVVDSTRWVQAFRRTSGSEADMQSAWEFAVANSKVMEHRAKTMDREIKNAMESLEDKRGYVAAVQEASMKHIALIQTYMVDLPTWHAAYGKSLGEHGDEQRAFQYADWVVEQVQGSGNVKDMAALMRNQSKTHTTFTMFMTFFSSLWNLERDLVKGAKSGRYSPTTVAAKAMLLFVIPVIADLLYRGDFFDDEDELKEDAGQKALLGVALYPVQSVPFVRDAVNAVVGEYDYSATPVASLMERGFQGLSDASKVGFTDGEITKAQVKGASQLVTAWFGVPGGAQAWATGEHLFQVIEEGEELSLRQTIFGPDRK